MCFKGKDEHLGNIEIDLSQLCSNVTHDIWRPLEPQGSIHLTITINEFSNSQDHDDHRSDLELTHSYVRNTSFLQFSSNNFKGFEQHS